MHPAILLGHPANTKWAKMPFRESSFRKNLLLESFRKTLFSEKFRKNLLPKEDFVIPEKLRNTFRKNIIRNVSGRMKVLPEDNLLLPEEGSSGNFFF